MVYRFNTITLDTDRYLINDAAGPVPVEPRVFDLLVYLIRHRDRVVGRDELLTSVWQGRVVGDAALSACLKAARRAVGDTGRAQNVIRTVHGRGYRFVAEVSESTDRAGPAGSLKPGATGSRKPSIRIVPFECLPRDEDNRAFTEELGDRLLERLSQRTGVRVVEATGSDAGRSALPDYLLNGRIRRMGARYRASLSMTWCATDETVWAEGFTGDVADPWTFAEEVTDKVDAALRLQFNAYDARRLADRDERELDPSELLTKAAQHAFLVSIEGMRHALKLVQQALTVRPDDAMALAMRVEMGAILAASLPADLYAEDDDVLLRMADRSIELDPRSDYGFYARGYLRLYRLHDVEGALEDARKSLDLSPAHVYSLALLGGGLVCREQAGQAIGPLLRAVALGKNNPYHAWELQLLALAYFLCGDLDNALDAINAAIQLYSGVWTFHRLKAAILRRLGRREEESRSLERSVGLSGRPHILAIEPPLPAAYKAMLDGSQD